MSYIVQACVGLLRISGQPIFCHLNHFFFLSGGRPCAPRLLPVTPPHAGRRQRPRCRLDRRELTQDVRPDWDWLPMGKVRKSL